MDNRYFIMRATFYEREKKRQYQLKLSELGSIWFCSNKNVKRILHQFEEAGKLTYLPGKGRGNPSTLIFANSLRKEVDLFIKECLDNDKLDEAAQLLRLPIPKTWIAKVSSDIRKMFGLQKNTDAKDILHSLISREVTTLDPLLTAISFEAHLIAQLGDPLVKYDAENDSIIPHIAHHFECDEEGRIWTFHLRKGVLFHHQEQLTSRDVEATIKRFKEGPSSYAWLAKEIEYVECEGPYKINIHLSRVNPFFLRFVASPNFCILPADIPFNEFEWIGTGPFMLKKRKSDKLVLEAFDGYFKERPLLDEIHFYKVSSEAASLVNYTVNDEVEVVPAKKQEIETGFRYLSFNFHRENVVQQPSFRKAIFHSLDMKKMAAELNWEKWIESSSFSASRSIHQIKDASLVRDLLEESGYKGEPLNLFHLDFDRAKGEANWFADEANRFGIHIVLHPFTFNEFYERSIDENADMIFMGEVSSLDLHLSFLGAFYNESLLFRRLLAQNDLNWIDRKLEKMKQENKKGREVIINEIESYIRENDLLIFQHHPVKERTFHPMIKDVEFQSFGHFDFTKLWIPKLRSMKI